MIQKKEGSFLPLLIYPPAYAGSGNSHLSQWVYPVGFLPSRGCGDFIGPVPQSLVIKALDIQL